MAEWPYRPAGGSRAEWEKIVGKQLGGASPATLDTMTPEGIKTAASDEKVDATYVNDHLRIGIDSLNQLINKGVTVKHLKF